MLEYGEKNMMMSTKRRQLAGVFPKPLLYLTSNLHLNFNFYVF